jgi:hypothetical protein
MTADAGLGPSRRLRARPLFGLAGLCACVLVGLLATEYHSAGLREARLAHSTPSPAAGTVAAARPNDSASLSPGPVDAWMRVVLARPLFSPSRRPATVSVSGPERPRLAGIIASPGHELAIFAGSGTARGIVAGVGQQAGAWRVLGIDATGVRVMEADGVHTLHPTRDASGRDDAASPALPDHPSILDLLRSRPLNLGSSPGGGMPPLPPSLRGEPPSPQTVPAAPQ